MAPRLDLHVVLKTLLGSDNVYFQAPPNNKIKYPCIIYNRDDIKTDNADNIPYTRRVRYQITVIDANPDSQIPVKVGELPLCSFDRFYTRDNLNHDVFQLFF